MVIKGNGAVNTMEAVKINTKEKERTKVTYHKSVFSSVLTGITWGAAILALAVLVFLVGFILVTYFGLSMMGVAVVAVITAVLYFVIVDKLAGRE